MTLRPITDDDRPFLAALYASTRHEELAQTGWSDDQRDGFLAWQFELQDTHWRQAYDTARFCVVEHLGRPIGRLYVTDLGGDLRIVDIALAAEWRAKGIGTALIREVMAEASAAGSRVSLHVEQWNPAHRLYERLGFVVEEQNVPYDRMAWSPPARP